MCLFCGLGEYLIVGSVYPPLNMDHMKIALGVILAKFNMDKQKSRRMACQALRSC
jgi:hypothetical protein